MRIDGAAQFEKIHSADPILDTRIPSVCWCCVTIRGRPLNSKKVWTGDIWDDSFFLLFFLGGGYFNKWIF